MDLVNSLKTLLVGSGVIVFVVPYFINLVMGLFGCSGDDPLTKDIVEVAACTGGDLFTIPVALQKFTGGLMASGILILTGFFKAGTFKQNFFNKSVPVVPAPEAKEGTVSPAMVNAGAGATVVVRK